MDSDRRVEVASGVEFRRKSAKSALNCGGLQIC